MPNFRGNEDLCKLGKRYLNDLLCKLGPSCLQHSKTFDISQAFLWATIAELSTLKQVQFFLTHPVDATFHSVHLHSSFLMHLFCANFCCCNVHLNASSVTMPSRL